MPCYLTSDIQNIVAVFLVLLLDFARILFVVRHCFFCDAGAGSSPAFRTLALIGTLATSCVGTASVLVVISAQDYLFEQVLLPSLDGILVTRGDLIVIRAQIVLVKM